MLADPDRAGEERIDELLDRGLERYVPDGEERGWIRDRLGVLLGIGSAGTFGREDLFSAWVAFLDRVGEGNPVTLIIDSSGQIKERN